MEDIVVGVIGGCGFLGQHIVRELQLWNNNTKQKNGSPTHTNNEATHHVNVDLETDVNDSAFDSDDAELIDLETLDLVDYDLKNFNIVKIKILDIKPFEPFLDFSEYPPISSVFCDVRSESQLTEALEGVQVVFHCAAEVVQVVKNPEEEDKTKNEILYWETNLEGTENVIWSCRKVNANILIYTSTIAAVMGGKKIVAHTETLTPMVEEKELILGAYARSRKRAEECVIDAHKTRTENENMLLTTVLRPVALYGEGDINFIPSFIDLAKRAGGTLPVIGGAFNLHQLSYAGNAAYAHICAMVQLLNADSIHPLRDCGGVPIYVSDDTPPGRVADYVIHPFLEKFGLSSTQTVLPVPFIWAYTLMINIWITLWRRIGCPSRLEWTMPPRRLQNLVATTTIVNRMRAELTLHYKPKYNYEDAMKRSLAYYKKLIDPDDVNLLLN